MEKGGRGRWEMDVDIMNKNPKEVKKEKEK